MRKLYLTVLGFVFFFVLNGDAWSQEIMISEISDYETLNASVMRPDLDTLKQWLKDDEEAPKAYIDEETHLKLMELDALGLGSSLSLLGHLDYSPSARNQASCGNCWVWASTGVVEIAHSVQNGVKNRLSTQFLNSCKTDKYACCGGTAEKFTDWYKGVGYVVPWSNTNGAFQDGNNQCSTGVPTVSCGNIATNPNYPLTAITTEQVPITGVSQSTAIANIKNVLNQNKAMYMAFFLPNQSDWDQFFSFWSGANASEGNIWNPDFSCGHAYDNNGGGHAVLLVGYNDEDSNPNNHYWILLNSWGTASNKRPNGLFRMAMNINYSCTYPVTGQTLAALRFNTISPTFGGTNVCTYSISPTEKSFASNGGSDSVSVATQSGCAWTVTESLDWVTITSGSSGTGNGTVSYTVSANSNASSRTGQVTIAGKTFTITQEGSSSSVPGNILVNPGFEDGKVNWTEYSSGGYSVLTNYYLYANSGNWFAWLGGYNYAEEYVYQDVTIPSNATSAFVDFWYWIDTSETSTTHAYDTMEVSIYKPADNTLLKPLVTLSNLDWNYYWALSDRYDISDFRGQTIRLVFYAATDYGKPTEFLVDDVGLWTAFPSSPSCNYSISPTSQPFGSGSGSGSVTVTAGAGCSWTASTNAGSWDWVGINSGWTGTGNGTVNYVVLPNNTGSPRTGTLTIASQTFTVTQQSGGGCTYSISPTSNTFTGGGGTGSVTVTAGAGCSWTASTNAGNWDWVGINSGWTGAGNGTVNYVVLPNNTGSTRTGTLTVAGQTFTVTQQSGGGCTYSISPTSNTFTGGGGTGSVTVTAGAGCSWTASTNAGSWDWVGISSGWTGAGNGTVNYVVLPNNTGSTRTGTLTVAGQTFTITQQAGGGCTYSISPAGSTFARSGGTGSVAVTAGAGCTWTASTNPGSWDWIGMNSGWSGTGNGTVNYVVLANSTGQNRTGTLTIAGQTFTVTQGH